MTAINPKAIRGPVTAVPVVAGKGIRFVEDVENNRVVAEVDETVLWTGEASGASATMSLSEAFTNFERVRFYIDEGNSSIPYHTSESETNGDAMYLYPSYTRTNSASALVNGLWTLQSSNDHKTFTISIAVVRTNGGTQGSNSGKFVKVVGINRIANN